MITQYKFTFEGEGAVDEFNIHMWDFGDGNLENVKRSKVIVTGSW